MTTTGVLVLVVVLLALALLGAWISGTASRLDRLHVRTDTAWVALDAALARRAVVARSVARSTRAAGGAAAEELRRRADRAERAERNHREDAENSLAAALAEIDVDRLEPAAAAELADAEARVLLARRFYNDAVRDTLALRTRRPVRVLRLGGTAQAPSYLEITERATPVRPAAVPTNPVPTNPVPPARVHRPSARVVLVDETGRGLLLRGHDPTRPVSSWWVTVGGGLEPGEGAVEAAVRELAEETGLRVAPGQLRGPLWHRCTELEFEGEPWLLDEVYYVLAVAGFDPDATGFTELERRTVTGFRWCGPDDMRTLVAAGEPVYPPALPDLLGEAVAAARGADVPATPREID